MLTRKVLPELGLDGDYTAAGLSWMFECFEKGLIDTHDTGGLVLEWGNGAAFIELMEAEALMARADREYLSAVYTFQESLTALEQAVGQKLAIPES